MTFDTLKDRLGSVPSQQFQAQPAPQVYPIGDIISNGVKNLDKILDTFSPLSKSEREAKLAQNMYLKLAYDAGVKGDPSMLQQIYGHQSTRSSDPYGDLHSIRQENLRKLRGANNNAAAIAAQVAKARALAEQIRANKAKKPDTASSGPPGYLDPATPPATDSLDTRGSALTNLDNIQNG